MAQETFAPSPTTPFRRPDGTRVPVCSANAYGRIASEWGMESVPCTVTRGLRSFTDSRYIARHFCARPEHEANAKRRFGVAPAECRFCHKPLVGDDWQTFSDKGAIFAACGPCIDKADR